MKNLHRLDPNIGTTVVKTLRMNSSMEIRLYSMPEDLLLYLKIKRQL